MSTSMCVISVIKYSVTSAWLNTLKYETIFKDVNYISSFLIFS